MKEELVKMSSKGQLVVPQEIREKEGFGTSDRFVAFEIKGGVVFKKVKIPDLKAEFESLSKDIETHFKKRGVSEKDVKGAVKWARRGQR
ncbi:MAG: AbrB family transcriptional regulator [Candidatus Aenigmarchaeota archaeon]|nr:AbrB family transcriptional regulator [Candidatus Aenigmarchaeota archaeon]